MGIQKCSYHPATTWTMTQHCTTFLQYMSVDVLSCRFIQQIARMMQGYSTPMTTANTSETPIPGERLVRRVQLSNYLFSNLGSQSFSTSSSAASMPEMGLDGEMSNPHLCPATCGATIFLQRRIEMAPGSGSQPAMEVQSRCKRIHSNPDWILGPRLLLGTPGKHSGLAGQRGVQGKNRFNRKYGRFAFCVPIS